MARMKITDRGIELIKHFESCRLEPYHDDVGFPTIGWGHLLSHEKWADLSQWKPITQEEADELLSTDLLRYERGVNRLIVVPLSPGQFNALVSFAFNLGLGALQASTLRRVINRREYAEAPAQFLRWVKAGGRTLRGLVRRRRAEALLGMLWE